MKCACHCFFSGSDTSLRQGLPELGLRSDPRGPGQCRLPYLRPDNGKRAQGARNRTGTRPETSDNLENVSQSALGCAGSHRLHDNRGVDQRAVWSRSTCCSLWNSPRGVFTWPHFRRRLAISFMKQIARNLTDPIDGFLNDKRFVLMDRDSHFSDGFRTILQNTDVESVRLPARSPNLNAHIERFHLSIKFGVSFPHDPLRRKYATQGSATVPGTLPRRAKSSIAE